MSILKKIKPCDREKPYIFISYSSRDSERVWQDVHEFQKRGYNVWLDERNLNKANASWKDDALVAIEDMYCYLVVFYVSASSMTSEACYNELKHTTADVTVAHHFFDPLKYIAVEVEPIDNMTTFARGVFNSLRDDYTIPKNEKQKKSEILTYFIRDFFDTNNEKVRVHPKDEPGRKMDYYDEIIASFPDEARIYEPISDTAQATKSEKWISSVPTEDKASIKAEKTEIEFFDEPAVTTVNEEKKLDATKKRVKDGLPYVILKAAFEKHWRNAPSALLYTDMDDRQRMNVEKYFFSPDIVIDDYEYPEDECIAAVKSTAVFTFGKEGFVLTNKYFYTNISKHRASINLMDVTRVEMQKNYLVAYRGDEQIVNVWICDVYAEYVIPILRYIIEERDKGF